MSCNNCPSNIFPPPSSNPFEPGPVKPNPTMPSVINTIISSYPRPCTNCSMKPTTQSSNNRFLNAACNYAPFTIYIGEYPIIYNLYLGEITGYLPISNGYQVITIIGEQNYVYIQKSIMIPSNETVTIAICNVQDGLDFTIINDTISKSYFTNAQIRVCNLAIGTSPLDVNIGNHNAIFYNIYYQNTTNFKSLPSGQYFYYILNEFHNLIFSANLNLQSNLRYTIYIFHWNLQTPHDLHVLIVEEH